MKIIPKNYYVGLSLIITSSYYFYNYTLFANKNNLIFFLDLFSLFLFSLFLFVIITKIVNFRNNKFFFYLKNIFYTYVTVQIIKAFTFLTYSKITLTDLIVSVINYVFPDIHISRIIIFIIPYILIFITLIILNKKNEKIDYFNFFKIFGFVLIFFVLYRESLNLFNFEKNKLNNIDNKIITLNKIDKERKVVWVLFDGFDPQIYEKYKLKLKLKNLQEFENKSVFIPESYSPSIKTIDSVPSMLMGEESAGHYIKNKKYYLITKKGEKILFSYNNSIFGNLSTNGLSSSILSSVIQYCTSYIKSDKYFICKEPDIKKEALQINKIFSGIIFAYSPSNKINFIISKFYKKKENFIKEKMDFKKIDFLYDTVDINDLDGHNSVYFSDYSKALENSNFIFLHLYVPHPGNYQYAKKLFGVYSEEDLNSHLLNLKITDIAIKKIYNEVQKYQNYMIIISSDHWLRTKDKNQNNIYPSLFMATTNDNKKNYKLKSNFKNVFIDELIYKFFNKDVNKNEDIKLFIEEKN